MLLQKDHPVAIGRPRVRKRAVCSVSVLFALGAGAQCAHAQSSVTLYGLIDTSVEITNPGSSWTPRVDSGAYRGSRIGLRGEDQIGSDTRILFDLENGFDSGNGALATSGTLFNRQAWIGIGALWGELRLGRQYSPIYIPFKGQLDAFGAGTIASGLNNLSKITQRAILAQIGRSGSANVGLLADALVMDSGALAHTLKPLERSGLIVVEVNPHDRRHRLISLTAQGRAKLAETNALWAQAEKNFESAFGRAEAESLRTLVQFLISDDFAAHFEKRLEASVRRQSRLDEAEETL